jgi:hypothetical protein
MQPVAINEMKSRSEILELDHYKPLHEYLCALINSLEKATDEYLEERDFLHHVVQKKLVLGNTYSGNRESTYRGIFYFLEYTFFEDVEDEHGYRENDVQLGLSVDYYIDDEIRIIRDIISDYEEVGYPRVEKCKSVSLEQLNEFEDMKSDFMRVIGIFVDNSSGKS